MLLLLLLLFPRLVKGRVSSMESPMHLCGFGSRGVGGELRLDMYYSGN